MNSKFEFHAGIIFAQVKFTEVLSIDFLKIYLKLNFQSTKYFVNAQKSK